MAECFSSLQACGIRASRLTGTGEAADSATAGVITSDMISVDTTVETSTGDDLEVKNGCGSLCSAFKDCDRLKRVTLSLKLCQLDFELIELLTGATLFVDAGDVMGFQMPSSTAACPNGAAFEVWTKAWTGGEQAVSTTVGAATYFHWVFPRTTWRLGNFTLENGFLEVAVEGEGTENSHIGAKGPFSDWPAGVIAGGGVTAMGGVFFDDAPPASTCGYVATNPTS